MLRFKIVSIAIILVFTVSIANAQNPITNKLGVSDPHVRVFNDTIYLYTGHDDSPTDELWVMKDWRVFSSTNLLDWKLEETISPKDNYMDDNSIGCWASDAASRNGNYYFYFSDQKRGIGVMQANSPTGPFKDALGKPLVAPMHDPTVFIDDDLNKTPYIIYGDKTDAFYIAELNDDMISTAEMPKPIVINGEEWEKAPKWMDKNYLFKYKDTYYLSWGRDYAISKNIYGPYEGAGSVGKGHKLDEFAHGSFFHWKGQFYHIWCYYLENGYKFRESIITYCHMTDDGAIVTDTAFLDKYFKNGVGQYDASWDKIEGEWFYEKSLDVEKRGTKADGFVVSNIKNDSWLKFANVNFEKQPKKFEALIKNSSGKGHLEVRIDSEEGPILGCLKLKNGKQGLLSTKLKKVHGKKDIYIKFLGDEEFITSLDFIKFH